MEICWNQGSAGVFGTWDQTCVLSFLISPVVGKVGRSLARVIRSGLARPVSAIVIVSIAMIQDVVATTRHVVDDGIGVDSNTSGPAGPDHVSETLTSTTTSLKLVRNGLIVEIPWVKLTILGPLVREDRLRNWVDFDAHPALLSQVSTFFRDVSMRPAKHLDNTSLLSILINWILVNLTGLPGEINWFEGDGEVLRPVVALDLEGESAIKGLIRAVGIVS